MTSQLRALKLPGWCEAEHWACEFRKILGGRSTAAQSGNLGWRQSKISWFMSITRFSLAVGAPLYAMGAVTAAKGRAAAKQAPERKPESFTDFERATSVKSTSPLMATHD